jgi:RRXRR protein
MREGKAIARHSKGLFYIQLNEREEGETQPVCVGVDPGSKREGYTVKSEARTYLNIQAVAVTHVAEAVKTRREMRRGRRFRKTPCRQNRQNRARSPFPPSTKARWDWKLRLCKWLSKLYPASAFVVEDIKAVSRKGARKFNVSFNPLQVGKTWFYEQLAKLARVLTMQGHETAELRNALGLKKTGNKLASVFSAHCIDSWVLANDYVGGHTKPDNEAMLLITPIRLHRRQLHALQPSTGGIRRPYGSTRSQGFKRGSFVKHVKHGLCYVGGVLKDRISLHRISTGERFCRNAKPSELQFVCYSSWRSSAA